MAAGIYLDVFASYFAVNDNYITDLRGRYSAGIYIHGGSHNYIARNIIKGKDFTGIRVARNLINDATRSLEMSNNLFASNQVTISGSDFGMYVSDPFGKFNEIVHAQTIKSLNSIQQLTDPLKSIVFAAQ